MCEDCIQEHLGVNIRSGKVLNIPCVSVGCSRKLTDEDIMQFASPDDRTRYELFIANI